jgi:hypothetical protein
LRGHQRSTAFFFLRSGRGRRSEIASAKRSPKSAANRCFRFREHGVAVLHS